MRFKKGFSLGIAVFVCGLVASRQPLNFVAPLRAADASLPTTAPSLADNEARDSSATTRPDPDAAAKERDIRKLLALTDAGKIGVQVASQIIEQLRGTIPNVPQKFWDDFKHDMDPNSLVDLVVPIYSRHFTHDDILQMIAFYQTPVGRKMIGELPGIMKESGEVGSQWGAQLGQQIIERLRDRGYLKA